MTTKYEDKAYWDERYVKEANTTFEWYVGYADMKAELSKLLQKDNSILV